MNIAPLIVNNIMNIVRNNQRIREQEEERRRRIREQEEKRRRRKGK